MMDKPLNILKFITLLLAISSVAACSSIPMNVSSCSAMDWSDLGFVDGKKGRSTSRINHYKSNCSGFKEQNRLVYTQAYVKGLTTFCTGNNAFKRGLGIKDYQVTCPSTATAEFEDLYHHGLKQAATLNHKRIKHANEQSLDKNRALSLSNDSQQQANLNQELLWIASRLVALNKKAQLVDLYLNELSNRRVHTKAVAAIY